MGGVDWEKYRSDGFNPATTGLEATGKREELLRLVNSMGAGNSLFSCDKVSLAIHHWTRGFAGWISPINEQQIRDAIVTQQF
jgi:hypothetical protein